MGQLQFMVEDLHSFERERASNPYHFDPKTNQIGYKYQDGVVYDAVKGYQTAFAYLHRSNEVPFTDQILDKNLTLLIPCGEFAHDSIEPDCILGVSGTISVLGAFEWKILTDYKINTYTMMPSVYGESKRLLPDKEHYKHLEDRLPNDYGRAVEVFNDSYRFHKGIIDKCLGVCRNRAILVIFVDKNALDLAKNYLLETTAAAKLNIQYLTEDTDLKSRQFMIRRAAEVGQVTFATASFGRGCDFESHDDKLAQEGGLHVLQTFVADCDADDIQIQGRTARQGQTGSWGMALNREDLKKQFPDEKNLESDLEEHKTTSADTYEYLCSGILDSCRSRRRKAYANELAWENKAAKSKHAQTQKHFDALVSKDPEIHAGAASLYIEWHEMLTRRRVLPRHTVFVLDDSGSMGNPLNARQSKQSKWDGLQMAYNNFLISVKDNPSEYVSITQVLSITESVRQICLCCKACEAPGSLEMGPQKLRGITVQKGVRTGLGSAKVAIDEGVQRLGPTIVSIVVMADGCWKISGDVEFKNDFDLRSYKTTLPGLQVQYVLFGDDAKGKGSMEKLCQMTNDWTPGIAKFGTALNVEQLEQTFKASPGLKFK